MSQFQDLPSDVHGEVALRLAEMRLNEPGTRSEMGRVAGKILLNDMFASRAAKQAHDSLFTGPYDYRDNWDLASHHDTPPDEWAQFIRDYISRREFWRYMKYAKRVREENQQLRAQVEELKNHIKEKAQKDVKLIASKSLQ